MTTSLTDNLQILTFNLDEDVFALNITDIREVIEVKELTRLPQTPPFMRGVINLRGQVVPVIDLKRKFDIGKTTFTIDTCIIIIEVEIGEELAVLGALADAVQDVIEVPADKIKPPPKIGASVDTNFIFGMAMGASEEDFIVILNKQKLFTLKELTLTHDIAESADTSHADSESDDATNTDSEED
ncbi:chemotaxis protein CheW [Aestuariibacter sp. AA17]|uniref:Chemotaxis protein CheW n=1 Tax=Fluctibacter corallii TaxID=2984329 RepID=A0ABT3A7Y6_9ALTE|nr:chemotaxis protein CheW [Aestuariibacter sp. AA17]MCV2884735.1 chemotaxis protein CheW [Aestuariibacter sp. AA17]